MRATQVSRFDISSGAAVAAYRLHRALLAAGVDSSMFVECKLSDDPTVRRFQPPLEPVRRLRRVVRRMRIESAVGRYAARRPAGYEAFDDARSAYGAAVVEQLPSCDVVNLHWVTRFVDCESLFQRLSKRTVAVWTLHDMHVFTGGCHYDMGCGRFVERCGACPQLGSRRERDLSRQVWRRKNRAYQAVGLERLCIVTPSRWMAEEARRSALLGSFDVRPIPNGVDPQVFAPRDRAVSRAILEIPQEARVLLFLAHSAVNQRKGFHLLREALTRLGGRRDIVLVSAGGGKPTLEVDLPHIHLGYFANERMLSMVYSAADLFVVPSLQDNLPNTILEAMACGTPVVAFDVGGIPEMVRPGETGVLVPARDVDALRVAIIETLGNEGRLRDMSAKARQAVLDGFTLARQAQRYAALYDELLKTARERDGSEHSRR